MPPSDSATCWTVVGRPPCAAAQRRCQRTPRKFSTTGPLDLGSYLLILAHIGRLDAVSDGYILACTAIIGDKHPRRWIAVGRNLKPRPSSQPDSDGSAEPERLRCKYLDGDLCDVLPEKRDRLFPAGAFQGASDVAPSGEGEMYEPRTRPRGDGPSDAEVVREEREGRHVPQPVRGVQVALRRYSPRPSSA